MRFVRPSVSLITTEHPLKRIEQIGRICYKSEDKITEDSYKKFIQNLVDRHHYTKLEHARVLFKITGLDVLPSKFLNMPAVSYTMKYGNLTGDAHPTKVHYATLSCSHLYQHGYSDQFPTTLHELLMTLCYISFMSRYAPDAAGADSADEPGSCHFDSISGKRICVTLLDRLDQIDDFDEEDLMEHGYASVHFVCDRGVSHELVRHRCAVAQESTRYCNYTSDKFNNAVTFVYPSGWDDMCEEAQHIFGHMAAAAETAYFDLAQAFSPQVARAVLPNMLKTEVVLTMPYKQWRHFFNLRSRGTTGAPHPDMKVVADLALPLVVEQLRKDRQAANTSAPDPLTQREVHKMPDQIPLDI